MKTKITTGPITDEMRKERRLPDLSVDLQAENARDAAFIETLKPKIAASDLQEAAESLTASLDELHRMGVTLPETPYQQATRRGFDIAAVEMRALIKSATSFRLGKEHDDDRRDYVTVHRQYGVPEHQQWAVGVCGESPMRIVYECADQDIAIARGTMLLAEIRRT